MVEAGVIVLAGGNSERMNFPKPYLTIEGKTFLEGICKKYLHAGINTICVVLNKRFLTDEWKNFLKPVESFVKIVANKNPERGRIYSLKLGAEKLQCKEYYFIQNVDNPFVSEKIILDLWRNRIPNGSVIPEYKNQRGHPVLISKEIMKAMNCLEDDEINFRTFLARFEKKIVKTDNEKILCNINTREDFQRCVMSSIPSE